MGMWREDNFIEEIMQKEHKKKNNLGLETFHDIYCNKSFHL